MNNPYLRGLLRKAFIAWILAALFLSLPGISASPAVFASGGGGGGGGDRRQPVCYLLTFSHKGSGANPIPSPTQSPRCKLRYTYIAGESIKLTAAPASGWTINQWTGTSDNHSLSPANVLRMPAQAWTAGVVYINTINLAALLPLTGPLKEFGATARKGLMMAISEWNAKGGLLGKQIKAVYKDTQCDAPPATAALNQLISQDNIRYVIGEICSRASIPMSEIADANHVVMISPLSTNPDVTVYPDGSTKPYVFRAGFIDSYQGEVMARFALEQDLTSAYLLYDPDNGTEAGLSAVFDTTFQQFAGQISGTGHYIAGQTDFTQILEAVQSSQAQVLFAPVSAETANLIGAQARALGVTAVLLGGDGWDTPALSPADLEGGFFTTQFSALDPREITQKWISRYRARYKTNPDTIAAVSYDATNMLLESIRQAGADNPALVKDRMAALTWDAVSGKMSFDPQHNPVKTVSVLGIGAGAVKFARAVQPQADCDDPNAFCVGLVTDASGIHDQSFNHMAWTGAMQASTALGVTVDYRASDNALDYAANIVDFAGAGFDAVITVGFTMAEVTAEAASLYPDTHFIGIDQYLPDPVPTNLTNLIFPEDQGGFMVGALAALMSANGSVGAVCGPDAVPAVWRFCEGYRKGAQHIDAGVEVSVVYHNVDFGLAFSDPDWGQDTAHWLADNGTDVVFGAGGLTGTGALLGAADKGIYAIGVDVDQYNTVPDARPVLLSSALKPVDSGVYELIRQAQAGAISAGDFTWRADYAPYHQLDSAVPAAVKAQMEDIRAALWAGDLQTGVSSAKPNIKVALMAPMTGALSYFGASIQRGAAIAVSDMETSGGVLGYEIETVLRDTGCNGEVTVDAATEVMNLGVHYVVGEVCSSASIPLSAVVNPKRVLMVSPLSTHPSVTLNPDGSVKDYVFRASAINPYQGDAAARFALSKDWTTAYILYENGNDFQQGLAEAFNSAFTTAGGSVLRYEHFDPGQTDFSPFLNQLIDSGAEVLYLPAFADQVNTIRQQAGTLGVTAVFLGGDGWESGGLDLNLMEGSYYISHYSPDNPSASIQEFVTRYQNLYGVQPDSAAAFGYDSMRILLQSIQTAGYDNTDLVKDALAGITYDGATGHLVFNPYHDPLKTMSVLNITGGQVELYASIEPE